MAIFGLARVLANQTPTVSASCDLKPWSTAVMWAASALTPPGATKAALAAGHRRVKAVCKAVVQHAALSPRCQRPKIPSQEFAIRCNPPPCVQCAEVLGSCSGCILQGCDERPKGHVILGALPQNTSRALGEGCIKENTKDGERAGGALSQETAPVLNDSDLRFIGSGLCHKMQLSNLCDGVRLC